MKTLLLTAILSLLSVSCCRSDPCGDNTTQTYEHRYDTEITAKIKGHIMTRVHPPFSVKVTTADGVVTLEGKVGTQATKTDILCYAKRTKGVKKVMDLIKVSKS